MWFMWKKKKNKIKYGLKAIKMATNENKNFEITKKKTINGPKRQKRNQKKRNWERIDREGVGEKSAILIHLWFADTHPYTHTY